MTPAQLAKSDTEAGHQTALFAWALFAHWHGFAEAELWSKGLLKGKPLPAAPAIPELKWLYHIPNGGSRGDDPRMRSIRGGQLKAQGVKTGVSDVCLPVRLGDYSGLYLEMKRPAAKPVRSGKGGVTEEQEEFGAFVQGQGFRFAVCYSWEEARDVLVKYLEGTL